MASAKALSAAVLLTAAALTITSCSGPAPQQQGDAQTENIDLRMTVWSSNEAHLKLFNSIADEYMADHPEISSITFDPLPFEDYTTTLTTQIAGGQAPDLAWVLENAAPDFVSSGALAPLTQTLQASEGFEYDDLLPSATELWQKDDTLYGYPFSTSPFGVFVNEDLLAQAGQPASTALVDGGQWNWEDVSKVGSAVNASTGKAGFVIRDFDYQLWDYLSAVWNGWGAQPWSEDGTKCEFNSPEMVQAFTFLHDAAFEKNAMPGPGTTADFFAGDAAFTVTQISRASLLKDSTMNWNLLPLPKGPAGEYSVVGQGGIGALTQGKNVQAATDFLAFFANPENSAALSAYFPPPRQSLLTTETFTASNPLLTPEQIQSVVIDGIANGTVRPSHAGQAEIAQQVRSGLDALWVPDADVEQVLDSVCESITPMLAG